MGSKQALKRLFHQMVSLGVIYESKKSCVMVPLIQDFPTQEKLSRHVPDEFLLAICGLRRVFTIFDISLDIMVPWLPTDFNVDIHALFDIHVVGWQTVDLYVLLSHLISFSQLNHASQGG